MPWKNQTWVDDDGSLTVGTPYTAARMNNIEEGVSDALAARVLHDASSHPTAGTGNLEWTHTPVAPLIRGVLVQVVQNVRASSAIQTTKVSYGGVEMTKVREFAEANRMVTVVYFLGDGIPQGAQTVKVTVSGSAKKQAMCYSQTAPGKLRTISQTGVGKAKEQGAGVTSIQEQCQVYGVVSVQANPTVKAGDPTEELLEENLNTAEAVEYVNFAKWKTGQSGSTSESNINWTTSTEAEYGAMTTTVGLVRDFGVLSAVPTRAGIGDRFSYLADSTKGIIWEFVYQGQGITLPWLKVGGQPLMVETPAGEATTSASYVNLTTKGPELTFPLKGDYRATLGAALWNNTANCHARMGLSINGAEPTFELDNNQPTSGAFSAMYNYRTTTLENMVAGQTALCKYRQISGGEASFVNRSLQLDPIRVG